MAALLNGDFFQVCEVDDLHSFAPLHSCAVLLSALFAVAQCQKSAKNEPRTVDGASFLLSCLVGFEVGPRAGHALNGAEVLRLGWHCGPIFGHPAAAAAASKLFSASSFQIEDAMD